MIQLLQFLGARRRAALRQKADYAMLASWRHQAVKARQRARFQPTDRTAKFITHAEWLREAA